MLRNRSAANTGKGFLGVLLHRLGLEWAVQSALEWAAQSALEYSALEWAALLVGMGRPA
jgi:hypothetical protein